MDIQEDEAPTTSVRDSYVALQELDATRAPNARSRHQTGPRLRSSYVEEHSVTGVPSVHRFDSETPPPSIRHSVPPPSLEHQMQETEDRLDTSFLFRDLPKALRERPSYQPDPLTRPDFAPITTAPQPANTYQEEEIESSYERAVSSHREPFLAEEHPAYVGDHAPDADPNAYDTSGPQDWEVPSTWRPTRQAAPPPRVTFAAAAVLFTAVIAFCAMLAAVLFVSTEPAAKARPHMPAVANALAAPQLETQPQPKPAMTVAPLAAEAPPVVKTEAPAAEDATASAVVTQKPIDKLAAKAPAPYRGAAAVQPRPAKTQPAPAEKTAGEKTVEQMLKELGEEQIRR